LNSDNKIIDQMSQHNEASH